MIRQATAHPSGYTPNPGLRGNAYIRFQRGRSPLRILNKTRKLSLAFSRIAPNKKSKE
jgi:hypothetical protein